MQGAIVHQEKPKQEAQKSEAPKEQPKKEQPKKEETAEETMAKQKNPLDCLPETKFSLYDFKTLIVNAQDKKESIKFLWDNFDAQGFSFWRIEYEKYPGEGEKLFMTKNLANGFIQRLETFRKYSFGTFGVYGDEPNLEVRGTRKYLGLFMWRGLTIPAEVSEHPSYEYHKFQKLEFTDPKTRALVTEHWCGLNPEDKVEGLAAQCVSYYK